MTSRLPLVLSQWISLLRMPTASAKTYPYPRLRNSVSDVLAEGSRKKIAHLLLEADAGVINERLAQHRLHTGESLSITSYIAKGFACAIEANKRMQAYRLGRSRLIVFDDVDLTFAVERESEGEVLPIFYILRAAHRKTAHDIHRELQAAKQTPLGTTGPMSALEMKFFLLPRVLRRAVWFFIRRNPYWFKDMIGTAGVTSMGMFSSGAAVGLAITPMTLTLTIGSIESKVALQHGQAVEHDVIHLCLSVDHEIIDGAPLMRFADQFKKILLQGTALNQPADGREDQNSETKLTR